MSISKVSLILDFEILKSKQTNNQSFYFDFILPFGL